MEGSGIEYKESKGALRFKNAVSVDSSFLNNFNFLYFRLYELYSSRWMTYFIRFVVGIQIIFLPFIEHPATFLGIPFWVPNLIEFICLIIYVLRWYHLKMFQEQHQFFGLNPRIFPKEANTFWQKNFSNIFLPIVVIVRLIVSSSFFLL